MSGMRETPSADLDQALIDLEADAPTPSAFERVARWRRACGDAESAAEWQTWSLLPPEQADLRTALAECWRRLGRFDQAARLLNAQAPSWHQLAMMPQEQLLLVSSEHLFAHPEDELNRVLAFLRRPTDNRDLLPHWRACNVGMHYLHQTLPGDLLQRIRDTLDRHCRKSCARINQKRVHRN